MALFNTNIGGGALDLDLSTAVELSSSGVSYNLTNGLSYALIIATGKGGDANGVSSLSISTTDPTTNKAGSSLTGGAGGGGSLVYVPSVDTATIELSTNAQVKDMKVLGIPK